MSPVGWGAGKRAGTGLGLRLPTGRQPRLMKSLVNWRMKRWMKKALLRQSNPAPLRGAALTFWVWTLGVRSRLTVWRWPSGVFRLELLAPRFATGFADAAPEARKNRRTRHSLSRPRPEQPRQGTSCAARCWLLHSSRTTRPDSCHRSGCGSTGATLRRWRMGQTRPAPAMRARKVRCRSAGR